MDQTKNKNNSDNTVSDNEPEKATKNGGMRTIEPINQATFASSDNTEPSTTQPDDEESIYGFRDTPLQKRSENNNIPIITVESKSLPNDETSSMAIKIHIIINCLS